ncbi:ABC transporter substrate-binding protein, partial [Acinetobacter baumannii]|uniref:ABC transporter substrate-binding protein n=1 Tax=Acinetobacter baumannii TaxID=470 RepID=UPI001D197BF4
MEWLKTNAAAGGAYKIEQAVMGERVMLVRNDAWKSGPLPRYRRVLWQTVPAAESRVASLVRGNADIVQD